jgi:DNA-binding transcriptional MerR regulator/quercetin dioxygenase-like cupin family protein
MTLPKKTLMTIGQVARALRVSPALLRDWERRGLVTSTRSAGRYRLYSPEAVRQLRRMLHLRRKKGVNPSGILHLRSQETDAEAPSASEPSPTHANIGKQLSELRSSLGLTIGEAASRTGVPAPRIASIEHGMTTPSIASFQKLTRLYRTTVLAFFQSQTSTQRLVRPRDRRVLSEKGVRMELLAFGHLQMQAMLFRVAPRATSGGSYQHEGEEFIYMLSGKFEIWINESERYVLERGDSLYFPSTHAHRWKGLGNEEAVLLWINSPPTF